MRAFGAWTLAGAAGLLLLAAGNASAHDNGDTVRRRVLQERTHERHGSIAHRVHERHARAEARRADERHDRLHRRLHRQVKRGDLRPVEAKRIHRRYHRHTQDSWRAKHRRFERHDQRRHGRS